MSRHRAVQSKVSHVQRNSKSVKTTIPRGVAQSLKVQDGDAIDWEIVAEDGKIIAKVRKA